MADSGLTLPSREPQELAPEPSWSESLSDEQSEAGSKASLALSILNEKVKSGALDRSELMRRIVAQLAAATSAKGVALALRSDTDGVVACCATHGEMAPPPGTPLNEESGFTAECLRNGVLTICEDSVTDTRVDLKACARMGVRSIVAAPIENDGITVGVLEALSDQPAAFTKQHIEVLLTLACLARSVITPTDPSDQLTIVQASVTPAPDLAPGADAFRDSDLLGKIDELRVWSGRVPGRVRLAIACGVAAALLLALFATAVFVWMWRHNADANISKSQRPAPQLTVEKTGAATPAIPHKPAPYRPTHPSDSKPPLVKASEVEKIQSSEPLPVHSNSASQATTRQETLAPPATVEVAENTQLSSLLRSGELLPAPTLTTSQGVIPASLQYRVEPLYPPDAKRLRIEGSVQLRAAIDQQGNIQSVALLHGNPILGQAAITAVRQWRYHPSEQDHRPTASTTDITIVFRLH